MKSSRVNPPSMTVRSGIGLTTAPMPGIGQGAAGIGGCRRPNRPAPLRPGSSWASNCSPTAASWLAAPLAWRNEQSVTSPVSGSTATCALYPSVHRCTVLCTWRCRGHAPVTRRWPPDARCASARRCHRIPHQAPRPGRRLGPAAPPPPSRPPRESAGRAAGRVAGAHQTTRRRSTRPAPRRRPRRSPACPGRCSHEPDTSPISSAAPGTSRPTRRMAAISWITVSWVATASSSTSNPAPGAPYRPAPRFRRSPAVPRRRCGSARPMRQAGPPIHQRGRVKTLMVNAEPQATFHRRSQRTASAASRSDNPCSVCSTIAEAITSAGTLGRPPVAGNKSANMPSGNSPRGARPETQTRCLRESDVHTLFRRPTTRDPPALHPASVNRPG